jgi:hypothetical protein
MDRVTNDQHSHHGPFMFQMFGVGFVYFSLFILEIGSHELFAQAGLKPRSSQPQPPK